MINEDRSDGSPELAIRDGSKPNDTADKTPAKVHGLLQELLQATGDLESIARSLNAGQRRSQFRVVN